MSYAKSNPLFEFDIYRSQFDNSWNFFISVFRWSFALQLSRGENISYNEYLDGNYKSFNKQMEEWTEEQEEEAWLKEFSDSVEGEEHLDDDHDYHELEGIYYSYISGRFIDVQQFNDDILFEIQYEGGTLYPPERMESDAIRENVMYRFWEKVISP
jgi:hypothetical protein